MVTELAYKSKQKVRFDTGIVRGEGYIVGIACIPIVSATIIPSDRIIASYMVQVTDGSFPTEAYPFEVIPVFECNLELR